MNIISIKKIKKKETYPNLKNVAEEWLLYKKYSIKDSTYFRYNYIINKYINPLIGEERIDMLEQYNFTTFIQNETDKLSLKTIKTVLIVLKSILKYSERKYDFNYKLDLIPIPKCREQEEIKILNKKEINKLEKYCYNNATLKNIGILICLNTGLRIGEICALQWDNIDLKNKKIYINKSIQRIYKNKKCTEVRIDTPKSEKSVREIPISNKLYKILKDSKKCYEYDQKAFFLTGKIDRYVEPRSYQYTFKQILKECRIQDYKFHCLRHTFATNCIQIGMDTKSLSEILGHTSVNITLNRYVHSSYDIKKKYLEKL